MLTKRYFAIIASLCLLWLPDTNAQSTTTPTKLPEVGEPIPEFIFNDVEHFRKRSVDQNDFLGKWLFLTFWHTNCHTAVSILERLSNFQKTFDSDIQFFIVGMKDQQAKDMEEVYESFQKRYRLQLPIAFDTTIQRKWDVWAVPMIYIIDPHGIVRHITDGLNLNTDNISDMIDGKDVMLSKGEKFTSRFMLEAMTDAPDSLLIYRSIITKWNGEQAAASDIDRFIEASAADRKEGLRFSCLSLIDFYKFAYLGENYFNVVDNDGLVYPTPIIDVSDKTPFEFDSLFHSTTGRYNYHLFLPPVKDYSHEEIRTCIQRDLRSTFGYEVSFENRTIPVWRLKARPGAIEDLKTKGGKESINNSPNRIEMTNVPMSTFCSIVIYQLSSRERIFVDKNETGYTGNIDVKLEAIISDFKEMKRALNKIGFDIVEEAVNMKVMVIEDPAMHNN